MIIVYIVVVIGCIFIAFQWAEGVKYMKDNHPDYKGKDFLGE